MFAHLEAELRSPELRVRNLAAATLWMLASNSSTLRRMPVSEIVPSLCRCVLDDTTPLRRVARTRASSSGTDNFGDGTAAKDEEAVAAPITLPEDLVFAVEAAHDRDLQRVHAVAAIGYAILEQRLWQARVCPCPHYGTHLLA